MSAWDIDLSPGQGLVEASAGTGKTWTLMALVLRALVEGRAQRLDQILLVTFTRAATSELRERLRRDLSRLAQAQEGDSDPLISALHARSGLVHCQQVARAALAQIDRARISTIHAFCQGLLQEFPLWCDSDPQATLLQQGDVLWAGACADAWRAQLPQLTPLAYSALAVAEPRLDPEQLTEVALLCARRPALQLWPRPENLQLAQQAVLTQWQQLPSADPSLLAELSALETWNKAAQANRERFLALARGPRQDSDLPQLLQLWHPDVTAKVVPSRGKAGKALSERLQADALPAAVARLQEAINTLAQALRGSMLDDATQRRSAQCARSGVVTYDDLIRQVDQALEGPRAAQLVEQVAERLPLLLVDEFQDTDAIQLRIFRRLCTARSTLIAVGDPKQAIYGFRGASLPCYLDFRHSVAAERQDGLLVNQRSHSALIAALNHLWAEHPLPFAQTDLQAPAVSAAGRRDGQAPSDGQAPVQVVELGEIDSSDLAEQQSLSALCAALQNHLQQVHWGETPCMPQDCAVLVRNKTQARAVLAACQAAHIPAVLHDGGDVWQSAAAQSVLAWLSALEQPGDAAALTRWLLSAVPALGGPQAAALLQSAVGGQLADELVRAAAICAQRGIVAAWHSQALCAGFCAQQQAQDHNRLLCDLRQILSELSALPAEIPRLRTALEQARQRRGDLPARNPQRLADDAVTIMTMHGAKGLEWPAVFLPFAWRKVGQKDGPFIEADGQGERVVWQRPADDGQSLGEELRLLYVAMTRPTQRLWLAHATIRKINKDGSTHAQHHHADTALSWLLHARQQSLADPQQHAVLQRERMQTWSEELRTLCTAQLAIVAPLALQAVEPSDPPEPCAPPALVAAPPPGWARVSWRIGSFSGLSSGAHDEGPEQADPGAAPAEPAVGRHALLAGARFGRCAHQVLEFANFTDAQGWPALIQAALEQHRLSSPEAHGASAEQLNPANALFDIISDLVKNPVPGLGLDLSRLAPAQARCEWSFLLPVQGIDGPALARVLRAHSQEPFWQAYADRLAALPSSAVTGFLTGFIDLLAVQDERWFVVDWKTNRLGENGAAYGPAALAAAMSAHHYPLQALLYVWALHRYLRQRDPHYDPQQHLGGAGYAFLRGAGEPGGGWWTWRPEMAVLEALEELAR